MATYVNNLRLKEITTGDEDGTWGTSTNTNLELITDGFSYGTKEIAADANETFTMPDATADATRSLYLKFTSAVSLTATREITLGPNTVSKTWIIENATTGGQIITIKQGSGATVDVANGSKIMVVTDGAGAGAAVLNASPTVSAGTVTSVGGTGTVNGITLTGTVTSSGNLTLGGTLANVDLTSQVTGTLPVANGGTGVTSSTGTGSVVLSTNPTFAGLTTTGNILFGDNDIAAFGGGSDLQILHDGTNSFINDVGTGNLNIATNGAGIYLNKGTSENMAVFTPDGAVTLYYDNAAKIATSATGVTVTGTATATAFSGDGSSLTGIPSPITVSGDKLFGGTNVTDCGGESVVLGDNIDATTSNTKNVIIGSTAAGGTIGATFDNNVCIGQASGLNASSSASVFIGVDSGQGGSTGNENVFVGRRAGESNTSGQKNVYIGSVSGDGGTTDSFNIAIGVDTEVGGDYNVSIGTGSGDPAGGGDNVFVGSFSGTANESGGENIGIGHSVNTPVGGYTKHFKIGHGIQGRAGSSSISIGDNITYIYADWGSSASWNRVSDERIKKDFSSCNLGLSFIEDLEPVSYRFKPNSEIEGIQLNEGAEDRKDLDTYYIGFKAQSVRDAVKKYSDHDYAIVNQADDSGLLSMSYEQLITPLVKSVQDLSAKVKELEAEIASLRG